MDQVDEAVGLKSETYRKVRRVYDIAVGQSGPDGSPPPPHARQVATEQMAALDAGDTPPHAAAQTERASLDGLFAELHAAIPALSHEGRVWVARRARQYEQQTRDVKRQCVEHLVQEHGLGGTAGLLGVVPSDLRAVLEGREEEFA